MVAGVAHGMGERNVSVRCPSVSSGATDFHHEPCTQKACTWWEDRCTAVDTVPVGNLKRKRKCALARECRWMKQAPDGVCPPMTHGTVCEHQGGTFNTFEFEDA